MVRQRQSARTSRTAVVGEAPGADDPLLAFAPYAHRAPRRNSITPERQRAFIVALAATGIVTQAAKAIGASLEALYRLRHQPGAEGFAAAWEEAIDRGMARLEDCALERALLGEERPVVWDGRVVTTWRRYDNALLMFLLRQRRAQRYGEARFVTRADMRGLEKAARAVFAKAEFAKSAAVRESIDVKLEEMRAKWEAEKAAKVGAGA